MKRQLVIIGITILLITIGFSGCTENTSENTSVLTSKFVGTWISEEREARYNFSSDGTFSFYAPDEEYEGTYELKDEKLWFTYTYELEEKVDGFNYSFSDNNTSITILPIGSHEQHEIVFTRQ